MKVSFLKIKTAVGGLGEAQLVGVRPWTRESTAWRLSDGNGPRLFESDSTVP